MILPRTLLPFLTVAFLALLVAACGSDDGASENDDARAAGDAKVTTTQPEPGSPEGVEARTGVASFALTPEITACMSKAGFSVDPTPAPRSVLSWSHDDGARVVIAPTTEVALALAGEIGATKAPANVLGTRVSSGSTALVGAAATCLDA